MNVRRVKNLDHDSRAAGFLSGLFNAARYPTDSKCSRSAAVFLQRYHRSSNFLIMEKQVFPFRQSGRFLMTRRAVLTLLCLLAVLLTTTMVMAADGNDPAGSYRVATDLTPMLLYLTLALGVSFLCSILEAVLLSVGPGHVQVMIDSGLQSGLVLKKLRDDLDRSLSAILTLNTIAHTVGAAGVGAEVADKFGDRYLGLASALLTLLVLVLSEVIPKTLGARHCRPLAGKERHSHSLALNHAFPGGGRTPVVFHPAVW